MAGSCPWATPPGNPESRGPAKGAIGPAFRFVLVKNADTTYYREDSECHTTTVSEVHANSRNWDQPPQDPQDLESELKKVPFRPFRIVTATGKSHGITIEDRPLLLVGKRTAIIGLRVPDADPYIVHLEPIALPH